MSKKCPKNSPKCLGKWSKWGKEYQHQITSPKMAKNGPKWSEMFRKMVQMRPIIPKPKRHPYYFLKTYLDTKFQLIWPSNSQENKKKIHLFFQKIHFWSFFIFDITGLIWAIFLNISDHFGPFLGHFFVILGNFWPF